MKSCNASPHPIPIPSHPVSDATAPAKIQIVRMRVPLRKLPPNLRRIPMRTHKTAATAAMIPVIVPELNPSLATLTALILFPKRSVVGGSGCRSLSICFCVGTPRGRLASGVVTLHLRQDPTYGEAERGRRTGHLHSKSTRGDPEELRRKSY